MSETPRIPTFEDILGIQAQPKAESPLKEISPQALNEIFLKDPRQISDEELDTLIIEYRNQRGQFLIEEQKAKSEGRARRGAKALPKPAAPKEPPKKLSAEEINSILGDLV